MNIKEMYYLFSSKGIWEKLRANSKDVWVVDISDDVYEAIEKGQLHLDSSKDGRLFAQLRNGNLFGPKLPIKKAIKDAAIDPNQVASALQAKAIEQQLDQIMTVVNEISEDVADVKQGQENDRLGLYYSGINLYLEANQMNDETMKKFIIAQSLKSLSDANAQIVMQIQSDVSYLIEGKYRKKRGASANEIDAKMISINNAFNAISNSYMTKAAIYYEQGEIQPMKEVFKEYGQFLDMVIVPISGKLAEFDRNDNLIESRKWRKRAEQLEMINEVQRVPYISSEIDRTPIEIRNAPEPGSKPVLTTLIEN